MNDDKLIYSPKSIEDKPLRRVVLVHGAMHYQCQSCGRVFRMWLEKGLEDKSYPKDQHKPVPFGIGCLCGGVANHIAWGSDIQLDGYRPITETMDYFENSEDSDCGVSHLRTDGNSNLLLVDRNQLASYMQKEEKVIEPKLRTPGGLEMYSTSQLKEEIRRRKRW